MKYRGRELPGFINYKTFEFMVKEQVKELEEPAVRRLKDIGGTTEHTGLCFAIRLCVYTDVLLFLIQMLFGKHSYSWPRPALLDYPTL